MLTSELIAAIENSISAPTYQGRYSQSDLINLANEETKTIYAFVTSLRQGFFRTTEEITLVSGTQDYKIPKRASGRGTVDVKYKNTENYEYNLPIQKLSFLAGDQTKTGTPTSWDFHGDKIRLYPIPTSGTLIVYYTQRHSKIVDDSRGVTVSSLTNANPNSYITIEELNIPNNIAAGSYIDITDSSYGFGTCHKDLLVSAVAGQIIYLQDYNATTTLTGVDAGCKVTTAQETILLQLPEETHQVLVEAVAGRVLRGLGYTEQAQDAKQRYETAKSVAEDLLNPRIENKTEKIVPRNGVLRNRLGRRFPRIGIVP